MAKAAPRGPAQDPRRLPDLLQEVVQDQFRAHPALARYNGDHSRDGDVPDPSMGAQLRREELLQLFQGRLSTFDTVEDAELRLDLEMARGLVEGELFDLGVRRRPFTDPTTLLDGDSPLDVGSYLLRDYAPRAPRVEALCAQLEQAPDWVEEALRGLEPRLARPLLDLTLQGIEGQARFLSEDVRRVLPELHSAALEKRLEAAIKLGGSVLKRIRTDLQSRLPAAHQAFALGAQGLEAMLFAEERVQRPVAEMLKEAEGELERLVAERERLLLDHFAGRSAEEVRREQEADHFQEADLLAQTERLTTGLRGFLEEHGEVPIPAGPACEVRPSPGFLTAWVSAAYEGVGLLETEELPCIYYVTTPQPSWSGRESEEWLRYLNRATLKNTTVHEVYPGHHVQYLYTRGIRSELRRFFWNSGLGEGWAHYAELLLIEAGLAEGDPWLELAQNEDALLRACRYRTSLGLHAEGWQVEDGTRLFMEKIGMGELPARREASRGTFDPLYLLYTMGKLRILEWRERWIADHGGDLRAFHRRLLSAGTPPLAAIEGWLQST